MILFQKETELLKSAFRTTSNSITKQKKQINLFRRQKNLPQKNNKKFSLKSFSQKIRYYFVLLFFSKNDFYHDKIVKRSKADPSYPAKFRKIRDRYERMHKPSKKKEKMELGQAYSIFSHILIAIILIWVCLNSFMIYHNFWSNLNKQIRLLIFF